MELSQNLFPRLSFALIFSGLLLFLTASACQTATTSPTSQQSILNSTCSHVIQFNTPLGDGQFHPGDHVEFIGFVLKGSDDGFSYESASGIVKDNIISGQNDDPIDIDGTSEAHIILILTSPPLPPTHTAFP